MATMQSQLAAAVTAPRSGQATVVVNRLRKVYRTPVTEVVALDDLSWDVQPGQAVALMGPSGCGKTTLLNLVGGMDRATSGSVRVGGDEITAFGERQMEAYRLRRVGYIFQFFNLIPSISALENLELPPLLAGMNREVRRARAQELLGQVGLAAKGHKRPEELSGGEQQRVAICLALVNDPPLIVGDEPTGNLDSRNRDIVIELLLSLARQQGKTVIIATHDPKVADAFSQVYHMRDGRFVNE
jgi:putative ABC transport system ATP-binding protein